MTDVFCEPKLKALVKLMREQGIKAVTLNEHGDILGFELTVGTDYPLSPPTNWGTMPGHSLGGSQINPPR